MSQYDYFLRFADKPAALADADGALEAGAADKNGVRDWIRSRVTEVKVWRASQDTTTTTTGPNGEQISIVNHTYLPGYYLLISHRRLIQRLVNHSAVQLVVDRDKMNARQPGFVIKSTVGPAVLQDIRISPCFLGMNVPWGGLS